MRSPATAPNPSAAASAPPASVWIGTYANGGGRGIYPLNRKTGEWSIGVPYVDAPSASFGTYASRFDLHYLVDEQDHGALTVHRHAASGWTRLARVTTGGASPCHVALDRTQSCIAVANYTSGSIAFYRLDPRTGLPLSPPFLHANRGSGPNPERQQSPHAHWVGFALDNRWLYQVDLGTDEVLAFPFDAHAGKLAKPHTAFKVTAGSGPRHLLLHPARPHVAYLACEMTSTLVVLEADGATFRHRLTLSTLPADFHGTSSVAHIAANAAGDRLYVSNRGHDSIAVFALDAAGDPTLLQHVPTGGVSPRFFLLLEAERRIVVAHERGQTVTSLAIAPDGTLTPTGNTVAVPGAAFAFTTRRA